MTALGWPYGDPICSHDAGSRSTSNPPARVRESMHLLAKNYGVTGDVFFTAMTEVCSACGADSGHVQINSWHVVLPDACGLLVVSNGGYVVGDRMLHVFDGALTQAVSH